MIARWLFLILIVLNLFLFFWGYSQPKAFEPPQQPLPENVPRINLLVTEQVALKTGDKVEEKAKSALTNAVEGSFSEKPDPQGALATVGATHDGVSGDATNAGTRCVTLGPFEVDADALDLTIQLSDAGHTPKIQQKADTIEAGYWVVLPANEKTSGTLMAKLAAAGIQNVWRFSEGKLENDLSLGLYSDQASAEQRVSSLREKGFNAAIEPRKLERTIYFVETSFPLNDDDATNALEQAFNQYPHLTFPPNSCDDVAQKEEIP